MQVQIKKLNPSIVWELPSYKTEGSAGLDLQACIPFLMEIQPREVKMIPTGLSVFVEDPGYAAMILPRSGLGHKGLILGNTIGLIDSDYQGELKLSVWNRSDSVMVINPLDRIAQLIFVPVMRVQFDEVSEFSSHTERGTGGYGSTGVK